MADRVAVMNAGRIVQVGAPQELYDRPASRFVADFLGEANFIDATVRQASATITVTTSAGTLVSANPPAGTSVAVGQQVTCCVRPERIGICPAIVAPAGPTLLAQVESSTYLGELRQYRCGLNAQASWKVTVLTSHSAPLPIGTKVALSVAPQDVIVLTA